MTAISTAPKAAARQARSAGQALRAFYSKPIAWGGALLVSAVLAYLGGAVMYWLHAIYRQEHGPAIGHVQHWLLDSTLGFVALTPVVLLLLPAVLWLRRPGVRRAGLRLSAYVLIVGTLFAFVTGPGPLLHNRLVGAGTPLANLATDMFGEDPSKGGHAGHGKENSPLSEGALQIAVGVPVYSLLTMGAVLAVRRVAARRPQDMAPDAARDQVVGGGESGGGGVSGGTSSGGGSDSPGRRISPNRSS